MTLARTCQERLDGAELRISKLRESFAPVQAARDAPGRVQDAAPEEYAYTTEDDEPYEDDPFA